MKTLKEYKEELDYLENAYWFQGQDGYPSVGLILSWLFTGGLVGYIIIKIYRHYKKKYVKDRIWELEHE